MTLLIKALGFANGRSCPHEGQYLKAFDFEYENGIGYGDFTDDPSEAMKFDSFRDAMEFWKTQSKVRPIRPDGEPNRPLTALSISLERYAESLNEPI